MKVKSLVTVRHLIEGEVYEVIFEYDSVYEIRFDSGCTCCIPKTFFEIVNEEED